MKKFIPIILVSLIGISACSKSENLLDTKMNSDVVNIQSETSKKNDSYSNTYKTTARYLIKKADKNKDGKVSATEIKNAGDVPDTIVQEFDEDKDTLLSEEELAKACRYSKEIYFNEVGMDQQASQNLRIYDKDKNGVLSYKEAYEMFKYGDQTNKPTIIQMAEMKIHSFIVLNADSNRDGKIDKDEFKDLFALSFETYYNVASEYLQAIQSNSTKENLLTLPLPFAKK